MKLGLLISLAITNGLFLLGCQRAGVPTVAAQPQQQSFSFTPETISLGKFVTGQTRAVSFALKDKRIWSALQQEGKLSTGCSCLTIRNVNWDSKTNRLIIHGSYTASLSVGQSKTSILFNQGAGAVAPVAEVTATQEAPFVLDSDEVLLPPTTALQRRTMRLTRQLAPAAATPIVTEVSPNIQAEVVQQSGVPVLRVRRTVAAKRLVDQTPWGFVTLSLPDGTFSKHVLLLDARLKTWSLQRITAFTRGREILSPEMTLSVQGVKKLSDVQFSSLPAELRVTPLRLEGSSCVVRVDVLKPWKEKQKMFLINQLVQGKIKQNYLLTVNTI